ncbi:MAG: MazG family protein [Verrucomicrobiales bacterium]|nr:MazG family protein [Verrucomicrobiales bacterium]|tara:strand:+ start:52434 stop:53102 length:669 start_codon:yes stop_codon:yes gene_type:complete
MAKRKPIEELRRVMALLRAPDGCPWDREQDHMSIRLCAVEEVYELVDAIEAADDGEMVEELGDLLLQVVFHAQMASERGAFDFDAVAEQITDKLVRRHPHVFGDTNVKDVDAVWTQWEKIKQSEKAGTRHERRSVFDGIPRHLPALMRAHEVAKKARKQGLLAQGRKGGGKAALGAELFRLAQRAQANGWSAEELLRAETSKRERALRRQERKRAGQTKRST